MTTEVLAPEPAIALAGLLDTAPPPGDALPPMWHLVYLLDRPAQADLGPDGHPRTGTPAPPAAGLRRMFAGGRLTAATPLRLGRPATRVSRLLRTAQRQGRSGPLIFHTVAHEYSQDGAVVLTDEHDLVYRQPAGRGARPEPAGPVAALVAGERAVRVDPTLLFRFSALTYNAHRIHYDRDFATHTEGYPGLLVHGPLQALLMAHQAGKTVHFGHPYRFEYRVAAPLFDHQGLVVGAGGDGATWIRSAAGHRTAAGTLSWQE